MRTRTWTYTGNISSFTSQKNLRGEQIITEIELYDIQDYSKAPVLLHVSTALMNYIMDIEWNDDEEKYMRKEFEYDDILCIRRIRILNRDGKVCKIIQERDAMNWIAEVIGPVNRISNENQKPVAPNEAALLVGPESFKH